MEYNPGKNEKILETIDKIGFFDIFNLNEIQDFQDMFSNATGVASIITFPDGTPITRQSNFCHFCNNIIRKTEKGLANCYKSDALIGRYNSEGPLIHKCFSSGLWDAGASITIGEKHIANWLIGQVRNEENNEEAMMKYAVEIGADLAEYSKALKEVPQMSKQRFETISNLLFSFANQLSQKAYSNLLLKIRISELEEAENLIRLDKSFLSAIIENQPGLLWLKDTKGRFQSANEKFVIACGIRSKEELYGKTDYDIWPADLAEKYTKDDNEIINSGKPVSVEELINVDGNLFWHETFKSPVFDKNGTIIGTTGFSKDITERKNSERELHFIQERNQALLEAIPDMMFHFDRNGIFVDFSSGLDNPLYSEPTTFLSKSVSDILPADIAKEAKITIDRVFETGKIQSFEYELLINDEKKYYDCRMVKSGENLVLSIVRDITDKRKSEIILQQKNEEIESQNEEYQLINEELIHTNEELFKAKIHAEESDRLKTAFLQNLSHEIRTPMNAIIGFSDLLVKNFQEKDKLEKYSQIINQRANDLLDIINEILEIAKIESGQLPVYPEKIKIKDLFRELAEFFKEYQLKLNKQHIVFTLNAEDDSFVITDKGKLKQVFINLISNAFKFTEKGEISGNCIVENEKAVFFVSDTGIGIPVDKQKIIFDRFIQLKQDNNINPGGTGLGLSIVKGLLNLMGSEIILDSMPGRGSKFSFSLPVAKQELVKKEISEEKDASRTFNFSDIKILIVEDDLFNAEFLKEILVDKAGIILHTPFGKKAVNLALENKVDLVLMDIRLPDIDGYQACGLIKSNNPEIKIIAQTAYASNDERQKAIHAGCDDYISKPIKKDLLFELIRNQINKKKK